MSRGQSPSSVSQSSSFSVDPAANLYISPYSSYYSQYPLSAGPSSATHSTLNYPSNFQSQAFSLNNGYVRTTQKNYTAEENDMIKVTSEKWFSRLKIDHAHVSEPTIDTPFVDTVDVAKRLLPYHVYQQPKDDLCGLLKGKGKAEALPRDRDRSEISETKLAVECFRRKETLKIKYHQILTRSAQRASPDDQSYFLAQMLLDQDRAESAVLSSELRTVRSELEKMEREKRAAVTTYYRPYPYSYTQTYTGTTQPSSQSVSMMAPPTTPAPAFTPTPVPVPTTAIPVQLPVSSLPALHTLGIIPVPAATLSQDALAQTPAVLRGSTSNGSMLSLEINVSLLHSSQMSGLALILNSLVSRSTSLQSSHPTVNGTSVEGSST